jgi:hypothetical protein
MAKAQKLQKQVGSCVIAIITLPPQAGKRDYYKILGVKRSATKKEISKVK